MAILGGLNMRPTKVHCFFEQSGTFKNAFIATGIPAEDYDIQNEFKETDHVMDLFAEIDKAFEGHPSVFDQIQPTDLIMAFFPCIHFCDAKTLLFRGVHLSQKRKELYNIMRGNIPLSQERQRFFELLLRFVVVVMERNLQMVIENPWNTSRGTYLQCNFPDPSIVDTNRALRGDYYVKPTAYWFFNREPTEGESYQDKNENPLIVFKQHGKQQVTGVCDEARSAISHIYAKNFIADFLLGTKRKGKKVGYHSKCKLLPFPME
jgi:hypothetical protein